MAELTGYLREYIKAIEDIMGSCADEESMVKAAKECWGTEDYRYLVFTQLKSLKMPKSPPDGGGSEIHIINETPQVTTPTKGK